MKMNLKKLTDKADSDVFDEIISKCESKMASPFKKEVAVTIEPEEGTTDDQAHEDAESPETEKSEISPEDLQKLLELYEQMKG